jgi:hypothetical protein
VSGVFPATARNGEILFGQLHKRNSGWDRLNGSMNGSVNNLTSLLFREGVLRDDDEPLLLGGRSTLDFVPVGASVFSNFTRIAQRYVFAVRVR